ncbi:unnamed protein product [Mortierella alpina]
MTLNRTQQISGAIRSTHLGSSWALLLALFSTFSLAQNMSVSIDPLWGMASAFIESQIMLVHGGKAGQTLPPVGQTFAVGLNTYWNTSQPDLTQLRDGFPGFNLASTLSSDNKTWFMMANTTPRKFYTGNGTWSEDRSSTSYTGRGGLGVATDPTTGLIYGLNGLITQGSYSMLQYNLTTASSSPVPMDPALVNVSDSAVVWSTVRKSMLVHGGWRSYYPPAALQDLYEFVPDGGNGKWTSLSHKGDVPEARKAHCLVPAYGGSKMILFGGFLGLDQRASSDIYSLDVSSLTWTKLTDPGERYARAYHACAVSSDMFVSWGGADSNYNATTNNVTLVYNLKKNVWQTTFSPQPEEGEPYAHSSPLSPAELFGIVVGIIGIILVLGCVVHHRRQRQRERVSVSCADGGAADHTPGGGSSHSADASTKKDTFQSLKSLKLPWAFSDKGTESRHLIATAEVPQNQEHSHQRDSILSHSSLNVPATAHQEHFYIPPVGRIEAIPEGDETVYRPNEIIVRGPQAIIDTSGYQDCKSSARSPHAIQ